jgi:hypothetical protein
MVRGFMLRVIAIVLALAVGYDQVMLGGRYTDVARQMTISILHHFRVV